MYNADWFVWAVGSGSVFRPHTLFLLAEWIWVRLNRIPFAPVSVHETHGEVYRAHAEGSDCHHSNNNKPFSIYPLY